MRPFLKKYQTSIAIIFLALFALLFSACGSTSDLGLQGLAGQSTNTENASTTEIVETQSPEVPTATPIPPATGHIIFASNRDGQMDLYMTTPDGSQQTRLTTNASVDGNSTPQVSPDGTKVAFVSLEGNNSDIFVLNLTTNAITRITDAPEKDASPSWSPDSQHLAFESFRDGNFEIYIANADGSNPIRLTNDPAGDSHPVWSPVANEIAFVSNRFGNSDLLLLNLNGAISTLTTNPSPDNNPVWSPDGNFIAFQSFSNDLSNICIIGRDGLNQKCLTPSMAVYDAPVWSHDGAWLAATAPQNAAIHLFNVADGSIVQLTQSGIEPRSIPTWSADGLRLAFQGETNGDTELFSVFLPTQEFTPITSAAGSDVAPVWLSN